MGEAAVRPMRVLIACEFSGRVRDAFRALGHDAVSCDLLPSEIPGPHINGDVRDILDQGWDLMIAHPPCTYNCNSGVRWLFNKDGTQNELRWKKLRESQDFFYELLNSRRLHHIGKVCIENPIPHKYFYDNELIEEYNQKIQPWQFGDFETKATCLWLKGLPPLTPTVGFKDRRFVKGRLQRVHNEAPGPDRWKNRSRTYPGIAAAMAEQWGGRAGAEHSRERD